MKQSKKGYYHEAIIIKKQFMHMKSPCGYRRMNKFNSISLSNNILNSIYFQSYFKELITLKNYFNAKNRGKVIN